jgi:HPt (histidine-containing phosphotransfer) domain-containing protein
MTKADEAKISTLLTQLWQKNLPTLRQRLDLLDQAAEAAATGKLSETSRREALDIAHKLSGSLGMFGHHQGTEAARGIEKILRSPKDEDLAKLPTLTTALRNSLRGSL